MVGIIFDYYFYQQSYSSLKSKNVFKFCVHISPISHARSHLSSHLRRGPSLRNAYIVTYTHLKIIFKWALHFSTLATTHTRLTAVQSCFKP